jgi:hypothetical protein
MARSPFAHLLVRGARSAEATATVAGDAEAGSAAFILRADAQRRGEIATAAPKLTGQAAEIVAADKIRRNAK